MNIQTKQFPNYPTLTLHKYRRHVFYKNLWHTNPNLLESRGRVYNASGKVVINPFTKVFNYKENSTTFNNLSEQERLTYMEQWLYDNS